MQSDLNRAGEPGFFGKYYFVVKDHQGKIALMVFMFLILSMLDLLSVGLIGPFIAAILDPAGIDRFAALRKALSFLGGDTSRARVAALGVVLIVVFVAKGFTAYGVQRRIFGFAFGFRAHLVKKLMRAYLRMPYQFYLERNSSTIVQSIVSHTKTMSDDMLLPSLRFVSDSLMLAVLGAFLFWVNPTGMILLGALLAGTFVLYLSYVRPRARRAGEDVAVTNEQMIRGVNQGIGGIKEIRVLQVEEPFFEEVAEAADITARGQRRFYSMAMIPRYLMETVLVVFVVSFSILIVVLGQGSEELFPVLAMFGAAGLRILPAVTQVSSSLATMNYSAFSLTEVYRDLKYIEDHGASAVRAGAGAPAAPFERLDIENVGYSYPKAGRRAVDGVSIVLRRGESVGLIGESGAGKTTLVDILLGLHRFDSGRIRVNGADLEDYGWERWMNQVAYIPQSVFMIDDTLERNVAFGVPEAEVDRRRVAEAIAAAQLSGLLGQLPAGLDTVLGERGIRLSGGERQRVALARAFYHNRSVFILDEATSALDTDTERQVIEVIEKLHGDKTLIVIAHRLSTVKGCDRIYKLQSGQVVASGRFEEVVSG